MGSFDDLLTLQNHDSAADRLRHRRATLPERAELEAKRAAHAELESQRLEVAERRDAELREERRLDDEVRSLEAKAKAVDTKMYSGTISSPKELQAMQADIDMLRRQARELEDEELEVLVRREELDAEVAGARGGPGGAAWPRCRPCSPPSRRRSGRSTPSWPSRKSARAALAPTIPETNVQLYEQVRVGQPGRRRRPPGGHELPGLPPRPARHRSRPHPPPAGGRTGPVRALRRDPRPLTRMRR